MRRMDLPGFGGERLIRFPGPSLECYRALEVERGMPSDGIVEPVDLSGDGVFGLLVGFPCDCLEQLFMQ